MSVKVAVAGATGRLGSLIAEVVDGLDGFEVVARLNSRSPLAELEGAHIVIDATHPDVSGGVVAAALAAGANVVIGTSGWGADRVAALDVPDGQGVIVIPNFSLGSMLATRVSAQIASYFDTVEVIEAHHAGKADSPSGTAVRTAELIAAQRGDRGPAPTADQPARGVQVSGVPVHSIRSSGLVAQQDVLLGGIGETITITHRTVSNDSYRAGIAATARAAIEATGVTVGLDAVLGLPPLGEAS